MIIPCFTAFKVSKGSGTYSDSKLYGILEVADLLEKTKSVENKSDEEKLEFLKKNLIGRKVKCWMKTVKKGSEEQYSVVDKFSKIWAETQIIDDKK